MKPYWDSGTPKRKRFGRVTNAFWVKHFLFIRFRNASAYCAGCGWEHAQLHVFHFEWRVDITCAGWLSAEETQAQLAAGKETLAPLWGTAAIDTGTSITCIARDVLAKLGTKPVKQATSQTASGQFVVDLYKVSLSIPAPGPTTGPMFTVRELTVMEMSETIPGLEALIGLDILLQCKLLLDGPARTFTLEF